MLVPRLVSGGRPSGKWSSIDIPSSVGIVLAFPAIVLGAIEAATTPWTSLQVVGFISGDFALLAAVLVYRTRARDPLVPLHFFTDRTRLSANLVTVFFYAVLFSQFYFVTLYLQTVVGLSPLETGLNFPLLVAFGALGIPATGALVLATTRVTSPPAVLVILVCAFFVLTCYLSVNGIAKAEVFPPHIRALGVGFGYAVANSLFGGTAPLIYHATSGHGSVEFIAYMTVLIAVTLCAALWMRGGSATALDKPNSPL
ncbi:hypothetical protein [Rhodococcus sp. IEGM 1330]|uniref:hypothetical protein n=1 Tax=Rhodococcus sp. IEGM 1330 TaxID=3082225 RepID=UPI00295584C2|nr:hypothetical protein [Rhodococcus sp. IEGM 1330]MDV8023014.1 hypothetical protein [Rhodococcus sp. IEGM 1330]